MECESEFLSVADVKKLVRKRDGYRCTDCGILNCSHVRKYGIKLDVHRLEPGTPYTVDGCVTLCRKCHRKAHQGTKRSGFQNPKMHLSASIDAQVGDAICAYADSVSFLGGWKWNLVIEEMAKEYLASRGFWPPKDA